MHKRYRKVVPSVSRDRHGCIFFLRTRNAEDERNWNQALVEMCSVLHWLRFVRSTLFKAETPDISKASVKHWRMLSSKIV